MWLFADGELFDGRYRIRREIGSGGMGHVYAAFDEELHETIAIKIIRPDLVDNEELVERFKREVRIARQIHHPNVIRIFEFGHITLADKPVYYLTMELLAGKDLGAWMRDRPFSLADTVRIGLQLCDALAKAHGVGVVHRDLKPANIFIDEHGRATLMDFGISRLTTLTGLTQGSSFMGTPKYMSPEQVSGRDVDARSDIYALGVVLFELATRKVPFEGQTPVEVALRHLQERPPTPRTWNRAIPAGLEHIILRCLEKNPEARYPSADALGGALKTLAFDSEKETQAVPAVPATPEALNGYVVRSIEEPAPGSEGLRVPLTREATESAEDAPTTRRTAKRRSSISFRLALAAILVVVAALSALRVRHAMRNPQAPATTGSPMAPAPSSEEPTRSSSSEDRPVSAGDPDSARKDLSSARTNVAATESEEEATSAAPVGPPAASTPGKRPAAAPASVLIAANPGTQIFIDGQHVGTIPPVVRRELEPGRHHLRYVIPEYDEYEETVDLVAGSEHRFAHQFQTFGVLRVVSRPYARVILDGKDLGFTPLNLEKAREGAHRLVLRREGFRTIEQSVTVRAGRVNRFQFVLRPLRPKR